MKGFNATGDRHAEVILMIGLFVCLFVCGQGMGGGGGGGESVHWDVVSLSESGPGPFLESLGNLMGAIKVFGDKCFLTEVNFCY